MRTVIVLVLFLGGLLMARAQQQEDSIDVPGLIQGAQQWAQQNLDTNVLKSLSGLDQSAVQQFFSQLQQEYQGEYVVDIASLRDTAQSVLPLLENSAETQPYAAWLKAQMEYLDIANEIRITIPPPQTETNPPPPVPNPSAQTERTLWLKKEASTNAWPVLAREYVPELKPIFSAQKVPADLVWVADVESGFDRNALSPAGAAGAAGMFQLMPDTAKRFGLSLWPRDQRYQPKASATASAQYLRYLYDHFKDWRLALASYNAGEGTVQKLLDRYRASNYDDIAEHLPAETQMYVPRIEAVLKQREGANLEQLSVPEG